MYDKVCRACGRKLSEFYNTYMLGCPECYRAFSSEIELSLKKVHGVAVHTGKSPNENSVDRELISEYNRLLNEKETAILEGRFENIAELSNSILELSEELKKRGLL